MKKSIVAFHVKLAITDEAGLREAAAERDEVDSLSDIICAAVINPENAPLDTGFEILRKVAAPAASASALSAECRTPPVAEAFEVLRKLSAPGEMHVLEVECRILDEQKVIAEAQARYESCWQDSAWVPETPEEALYEILVASNASPSPDQVGFEIHDWISARPSCPVLPERKVMDPARHIVATLIHRKRRARKYLADARQASYPQAAIDALEAAYTEAHNATEVARRILYHGAETV